VRVIGIITYGAIAIAVPSVAMLLFSDGVVGNSSFWVRGGYFWHKLLWAEVVILLAWWGGAFLNSAVMHERKLVGGAFVTNAVVFQLGCFSSLLLLLAGTFLEAEHTYWLVVAQILLVVATMLVLALVGGSRNYQADGLVPIESAIQNPDQLAARLTLVETLLKTEPHEAQRSLKALRERIDHSLPRRGRIASLQSYRAFAKEVEALCRVIERDDRSVDMQQEAARIDRVLSSLLSDLASHEKA